MKRGMLFSDKLETCSPKKLTGGKIGIFEVQKRIIYGHISNNITLPFYNILDYIIVMRLFY